MKYWKYVAITLLICLLCFFIYQNDALRKEIYERDRQILMQILRSQIALKAKYIDQYSRVYMNDTSSLVNLYEIKVIAASSEVRIQTLSIDGSSISYFFTSIIRYLSPLTHLYYSGEINQQKEVQTDYKNALETLQAGLENFNVIMDEKANSLSNEELINEWIMFMKNELQEHPQNSFYQEYRKWYPDIARK